MSSSPEKALDAIFKAIIADLNAVCSETLDEFTRIRRLRDLEGRALALEPTSKAHSLSALGSISAARGAKKKAYEYHQNSVQMNKDPLLEINFAVSVMHMKRYDEALRMVNAFLKKHPMDQRGHDTLVRLLFKLGKEKEFLDHAGKYARMSGRQHELMALYENERAESKRLSHDCLKMSSPAFEKAYLH